MGLPIYGDPANHAALLSTERINELRAAFGLTEATQWDGFDPALARRPALHTARRSARPARSG
jgi:hypothetical protein